MQSKGSSYNYFISQCVTYDHLSPSCRASLIAYLANVEPRSNAKTQSDPKWIKAMRAELSAIEDNNTWTIFYLPRGKVPIGVSGYSR